MPFINKRPLKKTQAFSKFHWISISAFILFSIVLLSNTTNNSGIQKGNNDNNAFWSSFCWHPVFKAIKMVTNLNNAMICQKKGFHALSNPKISFEIPISAIMETYNQCIVYFVWPSGNNRAKCGHAGKLQDANAVKSQSNEKSIILGTLTPW